MLPSNPNKNLISHFTTLFTRKDVKVCAPCRWLVAVLLAKCLCKDYQQALSLGFLVALHLKWSVTTPCILGLMPVQWNILPL